MERAHEIKVKPKDEIENMIQENEDYKARSEKCEEELAKIKRNPLGYFLRGPSICTSCS